MALVNKATFFRKDKAPSFKLISFRVPANWTTKIIKIFAFVFELFKSIREHVNILTLDPECINHFKPPKKII